MDSKLLLIKTIEDFLNSTRTNRVQCLNNCLYGAANYLSGKEAGYEDILNLLYKLKEEKLPFDLN